MRCSSNKNERVKGFTLVEAIMATVVLSIAAVALISAFTSGTAVYAEGQHQTLAAKLASDLMEEIVNTPFDEIVDVYHNQAEPKGQVKDARGAVFTDSNYSNFSRNARCQYVYVGQQAGEKTLFIRATVTVDYGKIEIANITMLIGEYDDEEDKSWTIDFL